MRTPQFLPFVFAALAVLPLRAADKQWALQESTLTYHVSHPLHQSEGVSHAARAKGLCHEGQCDFLIAAPVKSFDSGDSNRDLHMLQVVHGAQFPLVSVRARVAEAAVAAAGAGGSIPLDLTVEFAGQTAQYRQIPFQVSGQGDIAKISGAVPATLTDFKIAPPSLLSMAVKNEIPVKVEMAWKLQ